MKISKCNSNIYFFMRAIEWFVWNEGCIDFKRNLIDGNLMLQFSWLEEFRQEKVSNWWTLDEPQYKGGLNNRLETLHTNF